MNKTRNRLMYFGLGAILVYLGGDYAMRTYVDGPLEQKQARKAQLEKKIKERKKKLTEAKEAARKLTVLEKASLPSDTEVARSLYRAWLLELVEKSDFQTAHVDSGPATSRKGFYEALVFSVRGKGTLHQVVRFLFDFYHAGHLHKIQSLSLTPVGKGGSLDVIMTVEALVLPGSDRKTELSKETSRRLNFPALADYGIIAQRNVFGAGGDSDASRQTYLTAVTRDDGEAEAWFTLRGQDKLLKLRQGGHFEIGYVSGTVVDIMNDDVVFESVGERWLISVGEPLAEALALPPEF